MVLSDSQQRDVLDGYFGVQPGPRTSNKGSGGLRSNKQLAKRGHSQNKEQNAAFVEYSSEFRTHMMHPA